MSFDNLFDENVSFFEERETVRDYSAFDGPEEFIVDTPDIYDQIMSPIFNAVSAASTMFPFSIEISSILEDEFVNEDVELQGNLVLSKNDEIGGFRIKKNLKLIITSDGILSSLHTPSLPTNFHQEHKPNIEDYFPELNEEIESLCRMIMLDDDDNLAADAVVLKYHLLNCFEKTQ